MSMLEVKDLQVYYGVIQALKGISFEVEQGDVVALIGANGAGKTTTLHTITGLLPSKAGNITFEGTDITHVPGYKLVSMGIAHVPEGRRVFASLTVLQNLKMGAYTRNDKKEIEDTIEMIYKRFPRLKERKNQLAGTLSGGEQQMLAMGRALMSHPKLIIMDEPTVAVDPQSRNKILEGIVELNRNGATIIYTSHYMEEVEQICSRIAIMDKGKNLAIGTKDELKQMIKKSESISIDILDLPDAAIDEIHALKHVHEVTYENHMLTVLCSGGSHNLIHVLDYLQQHEITFGKVYSELPTLNDVFLEITGKELRD